MSFILKYKPYTIDEFFYDEKILYIIKILHEIDDLNILFVGNTGSGKTTILYAMIRFYYGLAPNDHISENNILLINNLKEQGINFYRGEMKTFCQSQCTIFGKKKMVIIDDVDFINEQCQQVFRNYIDKYKNNVHFISVCTNIQKVIESIQSRLHILKIPSMKKEYMEKTMCRIIQKENLDIDQETMDFILYISNYSVRRVINNLEKIYIYGKKLDLELCKKLCSDFSFHLFEKYFDYLKLGELNEAIQVLYSIFDYGYSVIDIFDFLFTFVKLTPILNEDEKYKVIPYICKFITIFHNMHEDVIELALMTNNIFPIFYPVI